MPSLEISSLSRYVLRFHHIKVTGNYWLLCKVLLTDSQIMLSANDLL